MLTLKHISKTYADGTRALDRVSLTLPTGMTGLLGTNGAGKSTLLRTLAGIQAPDSGELKLMGQDVLKVPCSILSSPLPSLCLPGGDFS